MDYVSYLCSTMKKCNKCKKEHRNEFFAWKNKEEGIRHSTCKFCYAEFSREWRKKKKQEFEEEVNSPTFWERVVSFITGS